jgi:hypothetical protein
MIVLRALDGTEVGVDENDITLVVGPYPHDVGPHTYVHGVDRGVLVTAEDARALVGRLGMHPPLGKLKRPNSTPVWIKGSAKVVSREREAAFLPSSLMQVRSRRPSRGLNRAT